MKLLISVLLIASLAAGGYFLWTKQKKETSSDALTHRETTAVAEKRDIRFAVHVAGEIAPAEQVSVRPEINGRIATLLVDIGDKVKKDDVLFTLDDKELQNELASRATEIDRAKLQLAQADRNFQRSQELHQDALISLEIYETSKTDFDLAKNAVTRSQRELSITEERLTKTQILAPFDCTVLTRPVSIGQAVAGSGGMSGGTEVLTIADLNQMVINAHVNQADVTRLTQKQAVSVQVEAIANLRVQGIVERIAPQATVKNNVKGFAARIVIKNTDPRIQPGMTANISIPVESADNVLAVKLSAIFTDIDPDTGQMDRYVYVKQADSFSRRPVTIGVSDYFFAEVLSGLAEGEIVALEPPPNPGPAKPAEVRGRTSTADRSNTPSQKKANPPALGKKPANTTPVKKSAQGT